MIAAGALASFLVAALAAGCCLGLLPHATRYERTTRASRRMGVLVVLLLASLEVLRRFDVAERYYLYAIAAALAFSGAFLVSRFDGI